MERIRPHLRAIPGSQQTPSGIVGSTLFVMAATLLSTLLGFGREVVNARYYGTQWEMDTFLAAATIPTILFGVFNGALVSALVPTFSGYLARGDEDEAWRLGNSIINGLFVILTFCAVAGYIFAPYYVPVIAHGFPAPQMGVAIHMTRWLMPSIVAVSLSGAISAMLNAYHRFRATAMTGMVINVVTVAGVVVFNQQLGIFALVAATTVGLMAQLVVQLPSFISIGKYRPMIDIHHPGLRQIWMAIGPIIVGSAAGQIALFFDRYFASTLSPGYMAGMNYAGKLVNFPLQIFAAAIATVIFPLLALQFARHNRAGVGSNVVLGLRLVNFITIPSVCALIVLANPIVQTLFEYGSFKSSAAQLTAGLLPWAAIGLVALAANVVLTRCCFACKETSWTVAISIFSVLVNVLLSVIWLPTLGAIGLLLANSLSQSLQAILLLGLVWRLVDGLQWRPLLSSLWKVVVCSGAMYAALHWIAALGVAPVTAWDRVWFLSGQIGIGAVAFIAAARVLSVEELSLVVRLLMQKFERNLLSPPENREAPIA
ncbi:MAG: murein biosynthesis integral membrane protein MurJ [Candidatus Meridianibacter frigidus]|nr:MAG: murein biosynthesis integral membrane protein MurJ [Candidatus Eremiobacteraeota bacterium]